MATFLSWSGPRSKDIAAALRRFLRLTLPSCNPWLSDRDISTGQLWHREIAEHLAASDVGVLCLTPENMEEPWILFEAGCLSQSPRSLVAPYLFELQPNDMPHPLSLFQAKTASRDGTLALLRTLAARVSQVPSVRDLDDLFEKCWPDLERELQRLENLSSPMVRLAKARASLGRSIRGVERSATDNPYLGAMLADALVTLKLQFAKLQGEGKSFSVPYVLYPFCLINLLREFRVTVRAVALVDQEEIFWQGRTGEDICRLTPQQSTRIFVFRTPDHMRNYSGTLRKHGARYLVKVLSHDNLTRQFPNHVYDYSLIGSPRDRLLARYEDAPLSPKHIQFTVDPLAVSEHEDVFREIEELALEVPADDHDLLDNEFVDLVFAPMMPSPLSPTTIERKQVEMSAYISPLAYDDHEEEHAYYIEMMDLMINKIKERHHEPSRFRILEFGAGTGIFTKRLAMLADTSITAIEIDWACYRILEYRTRSLNEAHRRASTQLTCLYEDSRRYNPPGVFDVVCSSFADHHIRPLDKELYFRNVARNLKPDGIFLVGDEFLPRYERGHLEARRDALRRYHGHIIDLAQARDQIELVALEEAALASGLQEKGDFKMSCEEYEELISAANFSFERTKIGPVDRDDLGGVFVYEMKVKAQ